MYIGGKLTLAFCVLLGWAVTRGAWVDRRGRGGKGGCLRVGWCVDGAMGGGWGGSRTHTLVFSCRGHHARGPPCMDRRNHLRCTPFTWADTLDWPINITRCARVSQRQNRWRGHSPSLPLTWLLILIVCTALVRDILMVHPWEIG